MLWEIKDFKGIESAKLDIRNGKITILTGINSSGKSSAIQSLLLAAQSLYNDGPIVLNGPLVRLGEAQDLVREKSENGDIRFRLGFDPSGKDNPENEITADFELVATEDRSSLRARRVAVSSADHPERPLVMALQNSRGSDVKLAMQATSQLGQRKALHLKSLLGNANRQLRTYVMFQGFRPAAVVQLLDVDDVEKRYRAAISALFAEGGRQKKLRATATGSSFMYVREFVRLLDEAAVSDPGAKKIVEKFSRNRSGNPYYFDMSWEKLSEADQQRALDAAASQRKTRAFAFLPIRGSTWSYAPNIGLLESQLELQLGPTYEALCAVNETLAKLAQRVQYLGPLRDEPRVVWNHWNELARGLPVGTRGEYSAAVLSRSSNNYVQYCPPNAKRTSDLLSKAVNDWLTYLEIGQNVAARSQGKLGVGFDLRLNGSIRDLTSVGVGVSQALPLLVGLLTTPRNSIFIVEQPELHLHPAVQARLADFMLTARPDIAVVIETHSEAFITRVRRRAAEGMIDVADVDITFVEPLNNGSTSRTLELSEFGDLSEWPEGFLSSAEEDIRAILKKNIQRATGAVANG